MEKVLGLDMEDDEYKKFWSRFDSSGDGTIDYAEFNNKLGVLIHPPAGQLLMHRPDTPRIKPWQRKRMAAAVKSKMTNLEQAFKDTDTDGSGSISHAELIQALRKLGLTKIGNEESYQMMHKHKAKGDTNLEMTWDEFRKTMQDYMRLPDLPDTADSIDEKTGLPAMKLSDAEKIIVAKLYGKFSHVQQAFRMFDDDKSGGLGYEEFKTAMRTLGISLSEQDFETMCMQYDKSGDGTISYDEFNARVGPMLHPDAINHSAAFKEMTITAGAQDGLAFNPHARLGLNARDKDGKMLSQSARARLVAPKLGLVEGEAFIARQLYGKYGDVQKAFRDMDEDGSGALNEKEFRRALESLDVHLHPSAFKQLMMKYDSSGDGEVSYDEFNAMIGPLLVKNKRNDILLGFAEEAADGDEAGVATGEASGAGAAASSASGRVVSGRKLSARPSSAAAVRARPSSARVPSARDGLPVLRHKDSSGSMEEESKQAVPMLSLGSLRRTSAPGQGAAAPHGPPSPITSPARSVRGAISARSRPTSALGSARSHRGVDYDRKTGFVATVQRAPRRPSSGLGVAARHTLGVTDRSSLGSVDVTETEEKMRRILGRSWVNVYKNIRKQQEREASSVISTHRFRDAMAAQGVPLTSKEVRALARRYSAATPDPESDGRDLDYAQLMRTTFDAPSSGRPLSELTSLASSRVGRPTA